MCFSFLLLNITLHSHRCNLGFAHNTRQPGLFINFLTDSPFIDFIGNTRSSLSPLIYKMLISFSSLAADHVTMQACSTYGRCLCLQPQIDVTAGGCVINGVEELYHPEEIQPTARD